MNLTSGSFVTCLLQIITWTCSSSAFIKEKKSDIVAGKSVLSMDPFSLAGGETCNKSYPQSGMFRVRNVARIWLVVFQEADSIGKWVFSLDCSSCCCRFQEGLYFLKKCTYNNCSDFAMLVGFIRHVALASHSHLSSLFLSLFLYFLVWGSKFPLFSPLLFLGCHAPHAMRSAWSFRVSKTS